MSRTRGGIEVREAHPDEYEEIGTLTAAAYQGYPEAGEDPDYMAQLRDVAARAAVRPVDSCEQLSRRHVGEPREARGPTLAQSSQRSGRVVVTIPALHRPAFGIDRREAGPTVPHDLDPRAEVFHLLVAQVAEDLDGRPFVRGGPRAPGALVEIPDEGVDDRRQPPELLAGGREDEIFRLTDNLLPRPTPHALDIARNLTRGGMQPTSVAYRMARHIALVLEVKARQDRGESLQQVQDGMSEHRFVIQKAFDTAQEANSERLEQALRQIRDYEWEVKSGQVDADLGLDVLLTRL